MILDCVVCIGFGLLKVYKSLLAVGFSCSLKQMVILFSTELNNSRQRAYKPLDY